MGVFGKGVLSCYCRIKWVDWFSMVKKAVQCGTFRETAISDLGFSAIVVTYVVAPNPCLTVPNITQRKVSEWILDFCGTIKSTLFLAIGVGQQKDLGIAWTSIHGS